MPFLQKAASAITLVEEYVFNYVALRNPTIIYFVKCVTILFFGTFIPGYVFMVVEGTLETEFKSKMYPNTKNKLVSSLFILGSKDLSEEVYDRDSRVLLEEYEKKIAKFYDDYPLIIQNLHHKVWTLWQGFFYSYTIYTTLGYGVLYPVTRVGRILTMMYGIIGIPLFLLFLTDLGKVFTRLVKYTWALIRRFYYTGSCRKRIKNVKKDVFTEQNTDLQTEMPIAPEGKLSIMNDVTSVVLSEETPTTVDPSTFEVDDEFDLPIPVALILLTAYIFFGALLFSYFEEWSVFNSFYYVFICFSTIGFGDFVPHNPTVEIISLFYECVGKAFMLVTVESFAERLSHSFQASLKLDSDIWSDDVGDSGSEKSLDILDVNKDQSVMKILHMEMEEEAKLGIRSMKSYHARMIPHFDNASTGNEVVFIKGDIISEGKNKEDAVIDAGAGDFVGEKA